jgi:crotonobetainyl-CoA:carnitine CoA-transferase CaiB-like acyl-CoA transferase
MHLTIAIIAALVQRHSTGRGQLVEVAMQEAVLNLTRVKYTQTLATGKPLDRTGNRSATGGWSDLLGRPDQQPRDPAAQAPNRPTRIGS